MFFKVTDGNSLKTAFYVEAVSIQDATDFWENYIVENNFQGFMQKLDLGHYPNPYFKNLLRTNAVQERTTHEY